MELVNEAYRYRAAGGNDRAVQREVVESLLLMLAPDGAVPDRGACGGA